MQVSFNTYSANNQYAKSYKKTQSLENKLYTLNNQNPAFTGGLPSDSKFLSPLTKAFDRFTDFLAKHYTKPLYESKAAKWLSRQDSVGQIVNHMQMLGSIIVSGMYMTLTLRNKDMDEETKKKLSINQALTWCAATAGAYGLDAALDKAWDKHVSLKYATNFLYDGTDPNYKTKKDFYNMLVKGLEEHNEKLKKEFETNPNNFKKSLFGKKKFKPELATKYISRKFQNAALEQDMKGLDVLKSLAIFGTIYRFVSPVAVTPVANMIGDKLFGNKEVKQDKQKAIEVSMAMLNKPKMSMFAGGSKKSA